MRFMLAEPKLNSGLLDDYPLVAAWAQALVTHPAVIRSVVDDFQDRFQASQKRKGALAA